MTFTEVAFELAGADHPLASLTLPPESGYAVYRILDSGEASGRHRAHVAYHGAPEDAIRLVRDLRAREARADVLAQDAAQTSVEVEAPPTAPGLAPLLPTLAKHGLTALADPIVAREGRLRVRLVLPDEVDATRVLRALQDAQRAGGFGEFRMQRIASLAPAAHLDCARRTLAPDQESILALAASMGYYATPKVVTLEEISRAVGLSISPIHKRLKTAEETIIAHHVGEPAGAPPRRRPRASAAPPARDTASPWEIVVRARGPLGPLPELAAAPGARAALHPLGADGAGGHFALLVAQAPEAAQRAILDALEKADAQPRPLARAPHHLSCRVRLPPAGAWSLAWFASTWGDDASVRALSFERGEAQVRALLFRPHAPERLQERVRAMAEAARWEEWDVVSTRSLGSGAPPPAWPEPLTHRQLEVLRVAHALGYYRTPRSCTLEQVAGTLGVSANAIHKNLVHAESKLIAAYLASGL